MKLYWILPIAGLALMLLTGLVLILFPSLVPAEFTILRRLIPQTMVTLLAGIFVIGLFLFRLNGPDTPFTRFLPDKQLAKSIFSVYIIILMAFLYVFPTADQFRLERRTLQTMAQFIKSEKVSPKNVYFYDKSFVNGVLYLNQPYEISILRTPEDLEKVIATKADQRVFIISQNRYFDRLPEKILKHLPKVVQEPAFPWDRCGTRSMRPCSRRITLICRPVRRRCPAAGRSTTLPSCACARNWRRSAPPGRRPKRRQSIEGEWTHA